FGTALRHVSLLQNEQAATILQQHIPLVHLDTPSAQCLLGRAFHGLGKYSEAERAFNRARQLEPGRQQDMEVYSTLLWFTGREAALSHLAHDMLGVSRKSPQAWCAVGNSFSLQKDPAMAIRCFQRAAQLARGSTSSSQPTAMTTLTGHELLSLDDVDHAAQSFRSAIAANTRNYTAWYGLGQVYQRTEQHALALYHFERALEINPDSWVLLCCAGIELEGLHGRQHDALAMYDRALVRDSSNSLVLSRKARLIATLAASDMGDGGDTFVAQFEEAFAIFEGLLRKSPDIPALHIQYAQSLQLAGRIDQAVVHYRMAADLDPLG
ncbi:TPR-like protein, partial [Ramicandelaber brevisporus]